MQNRSLIFILIGFLMLTGCSSLPDSGQTTSASVDTCTDLMTVANAFYDSNDLPQADINATLSYMTDDVILVYWAEGVGGHHMSLTEVIGKNDMAAKLNQPGLHRKSRGDDLPNYQVDHIQQTGN